MSLIIVVYFLAQLLVSRSELIKDPTVKPAESFYALGDAETISKKVQDFHLDRDKVAGIIFHRSISQRQEIQKTYDTSFTESSSSLLSKLKGISFGNMRNLYQAVFLSPENLLVTVFHKKVKGKWKEKRVAEEIICANDEEMKKRMKDFVALLGYSIDEMLQSYKKDDTAYQEVMQKYCWAPRCQNKKITKEVATKEAKALHDIDFKKDKEKFKNKLKELLGKYCEPDLKLIFQNYRKDNVGINDTVDQVFEGREKTAYNTLTRYIENTCLYYADELNDAVKGYGTDIDKINRIVLTRSERDLGCILKEFQNKYHKTFTNRLKTDVISEPRYLKCIRYLCGKT